MRVSLRRRVTVAWRRIFFLSIFFRDRLRFDHVRAYTRVSALRVNSCAEHKKGNDDRRADFQRFRFHTFIFRNYFAASTSDGCSRR